MRVPVIFGVFWNLFLPILYPSTWDSDEAWILDVYAKGFWALLEQGDYFIGIRIVVFWPVGKWVDEDPILEIGWVFYFVFEHEGSILGKDRSISEANLDAVQDGPSDILLATDLDYIVVWVFVELGNNSLIAFSPLLGFQLCEGSNLLHGIMVGLVLVRHSS